MVDQIYLMVFSRLVTQVVPQFRVLIEPRNVTEHRNLSRSGTVTEPERNCRNLVGWPSFREKHSLNPAAFPSAPEFPHTSGKHIFWLR